MFYFELDIFTQFYRSKTIFLCRFERNWKVWTKCEKAINANVKSYRNIYILEITYVNLRKKESLHSGPFFSFLE